MPIPFKEIWINPQECVSLQKKRKRCAFVIRGGISKLQGAFRGEIKDETRYSRRQRPQRGYVNYEACYRSIKKHIFDINHSYDFDVFIQSWNPELENKLQNLYKPKSSLFEHNSVYFNSIREKFQNVDHAIQVSQALAIKKGFELADDYSRGAQYGYDIVMFYRPDVLIWKDVNLSSYDLSNESKIYVNAHPDGNGDFHFIMSHTNAREFATLYDAFLGEKASPITHGGIQDFVVNVLEKSLETDKIEPGIHQEVLRKLFKFSYEPGHVSLRTIDEFGLSIEEIKSYA